MMENLFGEEVEVPLLLQICIQKIKDSLDNVKDLSKIPDRLLIPILDKCTAQQLASAESRIGRYIDTDELWKAHCHILSPENRLSLNDDVDNWRDLYTILEKEYQNKTRKTGETLRKIYNNAANNKRSKQIKVLNDVPTPTSKRPTVAKTASYKQSGSQSSNKYSTGGLVGNYSGSGNTASTRSPGTGSYSNVFKPSASNQPKLMAKVLKEHGKKFK